MGAILEQDFGHGLQPVAFASRKLNNAEIRYSAYERELLGIVWALGQWRHYFQSPHSVIVQTDHSPLRYLPSQAAVNTRVWKWLSIMQGYDLDIRHIPGKINPADHLSRQLLKDAAQRKGLVTEENRRYVEQLRIPRDATDIEIQDALSRLFARDREPVAEIRTETNRQRSDMTAGPSSGSSRPQVQTVNSEQSSTGQQSINQKSVIKNQVKSNQFNSILNSITEEDVQSVYQQHSQLSILSSSGISLDNSLKEQINSLLRTETPYDTIIQKIEEGDIEVKKGDVTYKLRGSMLVAHHQEQSEESEYWRVVVPDSSEIRRIVIAELHEIPFMAHPGISRTVSKVRNSFYWKGIASDVREFVEACPTCQLEKSDHTLTRGQLQSSVIPEAKWQEVSLDFITDLPRAQNGDTCILTVIDKATRMVHLIPCRETVDAAKTAELFWTHVGKLHGIPRCIYSDRGPQFCNRFWRALWDSFGTSLKFSSAYHPHTQGMVERMNSVVG